LKMALTGEAMPAQRRLPVFGVISRDYLKVNGRLSDDEDEWAFVDRQIDACLIN
jgi:hypothetical protein